MRTTKTRFGLGCIIALAMAAQPVTAQTAQDKALASRTYYYKNEPSTRMLYEYYPDGTVYSKTEQNYGKTASKWLTSSIVTYHENGNEDRTLRYTFFEPSGELILTGESVKEYDEEGHFDTNYILSGGISYDNSSEAYVWTRYTEFSDEKGYYCENTEYRTYTDTAGWVTSYTKVYQPVYDEAGILREELKLVSNGVGAEPIVTTREVYTYDASGAPTGSMLYELNDKGEMALDEKGEFFTDEDGVEVELWYDYDEATGNWIQYSREEEKFVLTLDGDRYRIYEKYYRVNEKTGKLELEEVTEYPFDVENDLELGQANYSYDEGEMSYGSKTEYTYEKINGKWEIVASTWYSYDRTTKKMYIRSKSEYTYDEAGRTLTNTDYRGYPNDSLAFSQRYVYAYDSNGNMISTERYTDKSGEIIVYYRYLITYDAEGRVIKTEYYRWYSDDAFVLDRYEEITYNADGSTNAILEYQKQSLEEAPTLNKKTVYTYDTAGNLLREETFDGSGESTGTFYTYEYAKLSTLVAETTNALPTVSETKVANDDNRIYDLSGRLVGTDASLLKNGIYIKNGKLIRVK